MYRWALCNSGLRTLAPRARAWAAQERIGLWVAGLVLVIAGVTYLTTRSAWQPGSDGFYSWIYARSLAFDADIDFTNDYRVCGDPFGIGRDRGNGLPDNIFYAGPALFWVPVLLVMRLVGVDGNGCGLPWSSVALGLGPICGALSALVAYRFVASFVSRPTAGLAVALVFLSGPVTLFAGALPSYSHIYEVLLSSLLCFWCARLLEAPSWRLAVCAGLALSGLILQRGVNVAYALLPLVLLVSDPRRRWRSLGLVLALGLALGGLPLLAINEYLYGDAFEISHGPYFLDLANAHPFLTLFDAEDGLLLSWPATWLALLGLAFPIDRRQTEFSRALGSVALVLLLVNSAALDWAPARRFLSLAPFLALGSAAFISRIARWLVAVKERLATFAAVLVVLPLAAWSLGLAWGASRGIVSLGTPQSQATLYGGGFVGFWTLLDRSVGTLAIAPAQIWAAAEYGIPREAFKDAAFARWYQRDFLTLNWNSRDIDLRVLVEQRLTRGLSVEESGQARVRMTSRRAQAVFCTQWPHVTDVSLMTVAAAPSRLRVGFKRGSSSWWSEWLPLGGKRRLGFSVREAELGSGIQQMLIESDGSDAQILLTGLEFDDRAPRTPVVAP